MQDIITISFENKLTLPQLVLLYFMHNRDVSTFKEYKALCNSIGVPHITDKEKQDLIARKYITSDMKINEDKDIFADSEDTSEDAIFETFFNAYPDFYDSAKQGKLILKAAPMTTLKSLVKLNIPNKRELDETLKDIQFGIDNDYIKVRIDRFFISRLNKTIREERLNSTNTVQHGRANDF